MTSTWSTIALVRGHNPPAPPYQEPSEYIIYDLIVWLGPRGCESEKGIKLIFFASPTSLEDEATTTTKDDRDPIYRPRQSVYNGFWHYFDQNILDQEPEVEPRMLWSLNWSVILLFFGPGWVQTWVWTRGEWVFIEWWPAKEDECLLG